MRILIHGFNHTDATLRAAVETLRAVQGDDQFVWLARARYHERLRAAGFGGEVIDEDMLVAVNVHRQLDPADGAITDSESETVHYLLDREGRADSHYGSTLRMEVARLMTANMLSGAAIDAAIFEDVPHSLGSYLVYRALEVGGRPQAIVRTGPAPHQRVVCDNIGSRLVDGLGVHARRAEPHALSRRYVGALLGEYASAEPPYMRSQRARGGLVRRVRRRLGERSLRALSWESIRDLAAVRRRQALKSAYEDLSLPVPEEGDYVTLFLHLQPERTTVPEAGVFAQQFLIAERLSSQLPDGWRLIVREHPSTFMTGPKLVRTQEFYRAVSNLRRTQLAPLDVDPFELISRSRAVACSLR